MAKLLGIPYAEVMAACLIPAYTKGTEFKSGYGLSGATPFRWTVLGLRLNFLFAESFRN